MKNLELKPEKSIWKNSIITFCILLLPIIGFTLQSIILGITQESILYYLSFVLIIIMISLASSTVPLTLHIVLSLLFNDYIKKQTSNFKEITSKRFNALTQTLHSSSGILILIIIYSLNIIADPFITRPEEKLVSIEIILIVLGILTFFRLISLFYITRKPVLVNTANLILTILIIGLIALFFYEHDTFQTQKFLLIATIIMISYNLIQTIKLASIKS